MRPIPPLRQAALVWAQIAANSFGGPAGQIAVMHRTLVEEEKWLSEERFLHGLNFCMLLPGPEAQQLCTWQGWVGWGYRGGLIAGWLFVSPAFFSILWWSFLYAGYHDVPVVAAGLLGAKAAVLAVVVEAAVRIGRRVLGSPSSLGVAVAAFSALFFLDLPFPLVIATAAALGALFPARFPAPVPPVAKTAAEAPLLDAAIDAGALPHTAPNLRRDLLVGSGLLALWAAPTAVLWWFGPSVWFDVAAFFSQAAVVTFGGAYSVLAWVVDHAVTQEGWVTTAETLDALALAETTPGPLIQVVQFIGFLATSRDPGPFPPMVAGALGAVLTTWVTYWPSFAFVLAGAPWVERLRQIRRAASALRAVTCAVVGVIANLSVWFTLHVWFGEVAVRDLGPARLLVPTWSTFDPLAAGIAAGAAVLLLWRKWPMLLVLALGVAVAVAAHGARILL
jgi:chromate transporter